jgi:hypothetical protein
MRLRPEEQSNAAQSAPKRPYRKSGLLVHGNAAAVTRANGRPGRTRGAPSFGRGIGQLHRES